MHHECTEFFNFSCKHDDRAEFSVKHLKKDGFTGMPSLGLFGGDYTKMSICMECGKIKNWIPITDEDVEELLGE